MKQTTNYKLNMPEMSDGLSVVPLNENTQKIDTLLHSLTRMTSGSYTGTGSMSVTIETPGMRPAALLVRSREDISTTLRRYRKDEIFFGEVRFFSSGFVMWSGSSIKKPYWLKSDPIYDAVVEEWVDGYEQKIGEIAFTPAAGSLSWQLTAPYAEDVDHSSIINNKTGTIYEWIALGTAEA